MPVKMKTTRYIVANLGLEDKGPVHAFFTATCAKAMDKFVPFREGTLAETVILDGNPTENVGVDTITYSQPYARYQYFGISKNGKQFNYSKDKHQLATSYWDREMWSANKQDIVKQVQDYVKKVGK